MTQVFCQPKPVCQMCKTKFPRNAWATLKELAANVEPIPLPNTVPAPRHKKHLANGAGAASVAAPAYNGPPPGAEVIEIL